MAIFVLEVKQDFLYSSFMIAKQTKNPHTNAKLAFSVTINFEILLIVTFNK